MSVTSDEIRSQPELWERAGALAARLDGILPAPGEQAAVIGCGTSWFMAQAYAALREGTGHGRTDAFAASEMPSRPYDVVLALSRSGTTTEVAHALMRSARSRTVAITAVPDSSAACATGASGTAVMATVRERAERISAWATSVVVPERDSATTTS